MKHTVKPGDTIQTKENAFANLTHLNNIKGKVAKGSSNGLLFGKSEETIGIDLVSGGRIFLTPDQYVVV